MEQQLQPSGLWDRIRELRATTYGLNFLLGVLAALFAFAIAIWLLVAFGSNLTPVPFVTTHIDNGNVALACPGDVQMTTVHYDLKQAMLVEVFTSYMDANKQYTYNFLEDGHFTIPHPQPGSFIQPIKWQIPDLTPGTYVFAVSFWMRGVSAMPVYVNIPYSVREGCP